MPNLKPFRDYSEHDVINLYSYSGQSPVSKGTLVTPVFTWKNTDGGVSQSPTNISPVANSLSARFDVVADVTTTALYNTVPAPMGILLKDVREVDENGEPLIFNQRKLAEMDAVLPNQAVPILTKGLVLINDIDTTDRGAGGGLPDVGDAAYAGNAGKIATDGIIVIGKFLSTVGTDGYALVKIDL